MLCFDGSSKGNLYAGLKDENPLLFRLIVLGNLLQKDELCFQKTGFMLYLGEYCTLYQRHREYMVFSCLSELIL